MKALIMISRLEMITMMVDFPMHKVKIKVVDSASSWSFLSVLFS